jgi:alkaline phosphatase D
MEIKNKTAHPLFEKLSESFRLVVNPISKKPAIIKYIHAIGNKGKLFFCTAALLVRISLVCTKYQAMKLSSAFLLFLLLASACQIPTETKKVGRLSEVVAPLYDSSLRPFYHGVASGDPLQDRVIIWTRVTPVDSASSIRVKWEMSPDENFQTILRHDTVSTTPERDYTVKVDVTGLSAGQVYYYRFAALGATSVIGRTKTLPAKDPDQLKFAVVSCSNWEFGYFNPYARIAEKELDAVVHLGDYIYEYAVGKYGNKNSDRKNLPAHEIVSLQDYRTRYSQYHLDQGLRSARQAHPFITVWDDHEVANDVYNAGAQNHQPEEGDFMTRKDAAKKAYYEWLPIRESEKHYRAFQFGQLADLIMLDERLEGRVKPLDSLSDPSYKSTYRTMLGEEQLSWFEDKLRTGQRWKIIGNQVLFSPLDQRAVNPGQGVNLDSWSGYPLERNRLADLIQDNRIKNVVFLAGDTHSSWAIEVINDALTSTRQKNKQPFAVEFGTTSVSSGNANEYAPDNEVIEREKKYLASNPHVKFTNHRDHGYILLTVTPEKTIAEWYYVSTLMKIDTTEHLGKRFEVANGTATLR